jgi:DNA-binding IclR family transcriptional regulator
MNKTRIIATELLRRGRNFFSLAQIIKATGLDRTVIRDTLLTLHSEGFLRRVHRDLDPYTGKGPQTWNIRYRVIRPKDLAEKIAPKYRGENNSSDRMWFIIRKKRVFERRDLLVLAKVSKETARWYTKMLHRAGIIRQGARGEWTLINDVGPRRPYIGDQIKR